MSCHVIVMSCHCHVSPLKTWRCALEVKVPVSHTHTHTHTPASGLTCTLTHRDQACTIERNEQISVNTENIYCRVWSDSPLVSLWNPHPGCAVFCKDAATRVVHYVDWAGCIWSCYPDEWGCFFIKQFCQSNVVKIKCLHTATSLKHTCVNSIFLGWGGSSGLQEPDLQMKI